MSEQQPPAQDHRQQAPLPKHPEPVDLEALTKAVERLLRRDLAIERERIRGTRRRQR